MSVAIIVPVLGRPANLVPLIENIAATTKGYRLLFVASEGDDAEIAELVKVGADHVVVSAERVSWACKINDGFRLSTEPWVFTAADDLKFHGDWFERAIAWADETISVVGTNDICNHQVMSGQHSTHTLFRRSYIEAFGTIDEPGLVMHEGYRHDFVDNEAVATAKARGVYVHAFDSIVEHMHPMVGKSDDDETYRKGRQASAEGRRLFQKRKSLWADEHAVRMAMVPPPERAVVVTATYGDYDCELYVPVEQDIPTEFVCFTDSPDLVAPEPWRVVVEEGRFPNDPRMSAKVAKMLPNVVCDDVVWIDASHEITSPSFVREALAARRDGIAVFTHPRRNCSYKELTALLGPENQGGLYFSRPLSEQATAYRAEGYPQGAGLFACGTVAWDLRDERMRELGQAWLDETEKWSHQDQVEFPIVCWRLGIKPGAFPVAQIDSRLSRGKRYFQNAWFRIHPHVLPPAPPVQVSVLIPFSSEDKHRRANFEHVRKHYLDKDWEVVVGTCEGEWSKGAAVADAFRQATHDVVVIADADCLVDNAALEQAVRAVADGAAWAVPHRRTWRLNQQATSRVVQQGQVLRPQGNPQQAIIGGGIVVCSRETWERSGGIDPRFVGWGGEDLAYGWALATLCGPGVYGKGRLFHLWHPPQEPRRGSPASEELAGRYRRARGDADAMTSLIEEAKALA